MMGTAAPCLGRNLPSATTTKNAEALRAGMTHAQFAPIDSSKGIFVWTPVRRRRTNRRAPCEDARRRTAVRPYKQPIVGALGVYHFMRSISSTLTDERFLYRRRMMATANANSAAAIVMTNMIITCPRAR